MAEQENIQMAHYAISCLNTHDIEGNVGLIDESYIGESEIAPGPIRGPEGVRQQLEMLLGAFSDLHLELLQVIARGDHIAVRTRVTGTHTGSFAGIPPTNKTISWGSSNFVEVSNGKAIRSRMYLDYASVSRQLGALSVPKAAAAG